jgi:hypothetical protein
MPTNGEWVRQTSGGAGSGGSYYIPGLNGNKVWPFGPFGLYKAQNGPGGGQWASREGGKKLSWLGESGESAAHKASMHYYGWQSIFENSAGGAFGRFNDMFQAYEDLQDYTLPNTYWISNGGCSWGGNIEPNGNYDAYTWLNYVYNANGDVIHCDDSDNGTLFGTGEYSYVHYSCVTLDSYFPFSGGVPKEAGAWDGMLDPAVDDPTTFSKMAEANARKILGSNNVEPISIKIAPDPSDPVPSYSGLLCARLTIVNVGGGFSTATPTGVSGSTASATAEDYNYYKCIKVEENQILRDDPITFTWGGNLPASPEAIVEVKMSSCATVAEIGTAACETNDVNASRFSLRPTITEDTSPKNLISGTVYTEDTPNPSATPYPTVAFPSGGINAKATAGYQRESDPLKRSSLSGCSVSDGFFCVDAIDKKPQIGDVSDLVDANISFSAVYSYNAQVHTLSYDDVGEIELWIFDRNWTAIDQPSGDCVFGSYSSEINLTGSKGDGYWGKIGCDIRSKIGEINEKPSEFNIAAMTIKGPTEYRDDLASGKYSYVYYANESEANLTNLNGQFVVVTIEAQALNAKGDVTAKYSDGNYSRDIRHDLEFISSAEYDMPSEVLSELWKGYWDELNVTYPLRPITPASEWYEGNASLKYAINFNRDFKKPMPVFFIQAKNPPLSPDFNLSLTDVDGVYGAADWTEDLAGTTGYRNVDFIYGRAHLWNVTTKGVDANVSYAIDYFSDRNGTVDGVRGSFNSPSALASSAGWYNIPSDNPFNPGFSIDGATTATIRARLAADVDETLVNGELRELNYPAGNIRPRRFVSHLTDLPTYLWYHPFGKAYNYVHADVENSRGCFEHPCGTIEFLIPDQDGWGGYGVGESGRHYDDNSTRDRAPIRLGR